MQSLEKKTSVMLRIGGVLLLGIIMFAAVTVGVLQGTFKDSGVNERRAENGHVVLQEDAFENHQPFYLNGEWEYYSDAFQVKEEFDYSKLDKNKKEFVALPISSADNAVGSATYRLVMGTEQDIRGYAFYLPNYNEAFAIYVNGTRVMPIDVDAKKKMLYTMSDYLYIIDFDVPPGETEIIISANEDESQSLLYLKTVILGPVSDVTNYVAYVWRDDTFLIGAILVLVIMGLVFMLIRTRAGVLLSIALFDTFLALRILLGFQVVTYFLHQIVPGQFLGNIEFVGLQFVVFFLTGSMGCTLSQSIFDADKKLPVWPLKLQNKICLVGSIFSLCFYKHAPFLCIIVLFVVLLCSFIIVTWHIYHKIIDKKFNGYYAFQTINTYYIGVLLGIDILFLRGRSYNALVYAYVVFLLAHLLSRLMDSNANYREVESLNRNLEVIIEKRTKELTEVNEYLSELSIRDPLTQSFNRLYFEEKLDSIISEPGEEEIHLCMFDLDFFKQINDSFGHSAGDEQLKFVVQTANKILTDSAILTRIGGEEFAILFQKEPSKCVLDILEKIRVEIEADARNNEARTTASFGVAKYKASYTAKEFFRLADKRLYEAKENGKNRIVFE